MKFRKNVSLAKYSTFKIGGKAKYFFISSTEKDLIKAVKTAKELNPVRDKSLNGVKMPFFILGGGSNLLVSDKGYDGAVIKMKNEKLKIKNYNSKFKIFCESGTPLAKLVNASVEKGLTGLEWAAGIPGTVGGAVRGNAGAFGNSISDIVKTVKCLEAESLNIKVLRNKDCKFEYRDSIFKKNKNLIILSAEMKLKKVYELRSSSPTSSIERVRKNIKKNLEQRKKTQPLNFPSAGSVFRNVKYEIKNEKLLEEFPKLKEFNKKGIIPTGYLIEGCGLKGKKIGKAKISEKHSNFIVNLGGAKADDVKKLINLAKKQVKKKFKIILEEEIQYL